uniref:Uncharacterized protein n=1 Tax=Meloidogyne enterolobii TaxID=390850 RepID=A0A6V7VYR1_MELEN|nr:unnamed protein product [Meloidogyne enterolobii]
MSSKLEKNADNSTTSNSSNDYSASHSQQKKRKRTLEMDMEQTNLEMKSIQDKVDLENFKMKLIKDKSDLQNSLKNEMNKNEKLAEDVEKSNVEKEEYKKRSELTSEEMAQLKKDHIKVNYRNACQVPTGEKAALLKQNNQLSTELQHANSELTKCRNELALNLKLIRYVPITNKINEISNYYTCCGDKCINSNLSDGTCNKGQSFIRVQDDGRVKYYAAEDINIQML